MEKVAAAPTTGQAQNSNSATTSPTTALVVDNKTSTPINLSVSEPRAVDAALRGGHYVRYVSDPASGIWRTAGDGIREHVSPFAIVGIEPGRGEAAEIEVVLRGTADERHYEGGLDQIATLLWRAGQRYGCRAERKTLYWALFEFCGLARRQAAARAVQV